MVMGRKGQNTFLWQEFVSGHMNFGHPEDVILAQITEQGVEDTV